MLAAVALKLLLTIAQDPATQSVPQPVEQDLLAKRIEAKIRESHDALSEREAAIAKLRAKIELARASIAAVEEGRAVSIDPNDPNKPKAELARLSGELAQQEAELRKERRAREVLIRETLDLAPTVHALSGEGSEDAERAMREFELEYDRSPSFHWDLLAGVQLTRDNAKFSDFNEYVRFEASDRFGTPEHDDDDDPWSFNRVYGLFGASLEAIPVDKNGGTQSDFSESEKSASITIGGEWRALEWTSSDEGHRTFASLYFRQGFHSFTGGVPNDAASNVGTTNTSYLVGVRIGEREPIIGGNRRNVGLYRHVIVGYGDYEQFGNKVLTVEGQLRFARDTSRGFFLGARAIYGDDSDQEDFAFIFGVNDALGFLAPIFKRVTSTLSGDV